MAEKYTRRTAKGSFARARNALSSHIQNQAEESIMLAAKTHLDECYFKLEEAHNKYLEAAQITKESLEDAH